MYLCQECQSRSETEECEWCGEDCIEVDTIVTMKVQLQCKTCNSKVIKTVEWYEGDIPPIETKLFCPICLKVTEHTPSIIHQKIDEYSEYLAKAYINELREKN